MSNSDYFLINNLQYFPNSKKMLIADKMNNLDNEQKKIIYGLSIKKTEWQLALYWICPFYFIIDRFIIGQWFTGLFKAILLPFLSLIFFVSGSSKGMLYALGIWGVLFMWVMIDGFTIISRIKSQNFKRLNKLFIKNGIGKI